MAQVPCGTTGVAVIFLVGGVPVSLNPVKERNITFTIRSRPDGGIEGILSVLASKENDNAKIECKVITSGGKEESCDPVTLRVQGECLYSRHACPISHYVVVTMSSLLVVRKEPNNKPYK